jgi:hypothetical protein
MVPPTKMPDDNQEFTVSSVGRITCYTEPFRVFRQLLQSNVGIATYMKPQLICSSLCPVIFQTFTVFAAVWFRSSLFCNVAQRKLLVRCRRFGPIFQGHDFQHLGVPVYSALYCRTVNIHHSSLIALIFDVK